MIMMMTMMVTMMMMIMMMMMMMIVMIMGGGMPEVELGNLWQQFRTISQCNFWHFLVEVFLFLLILDGDDDDDDDTNKRWKQTKQYFCSSSHCCPSIAAPPYSIMMMMKMMMMIIISMPLITMMNMMMMAFSLYLFGTFFVFEQTLFYVLVAFATREEGGWVKGSEGCGHKVFPRLVCLCTAPHWGGGGGSPPITRPSSSLGEVLLPSPTFTHHLPLCLRLQIQCSDLFQLMRNW